MSHLSTSPVFMLIMGSLCSRCYECCCGETDDALHPLNKNCVTTVRRISSVGITVINEDGEESEIPRHSSILQSYNGVPFSSTPLSIQPGVTKEDVASRIQALPTIVETPPSKPRRSKGWKRALTSPKADSSPDRKTREKDKPKEGSNIQLAFFKKVHDSNEVSVSQDDMVGKRATLNDPYWRPLRRPSYSSSPNLFALKAMDKSSQHMMTLAEYTQNDKSPDERRSSWLQSQSVEQLSEESESEASKLAKQYGLDLSLYVDRDVSAMTEHMPAVIVEPLAFWMERSYGTVDIVVSIDALQKLVTVTVVGARGLSGVGPQRQVYPLLFKISVLNDKKSAKTSRKLAGSSNPKINQTYVFHVRDVNSRGFRISIFHAEFLGRHDAIGHALFNFREASKDLKSFSLKLGRPSTLDSCSAVIEVVLSMKDALNITVLRVSKIPQKYRQCRLYVKQSYFSLSKKAKERVSSACCKEDDKDYLTFDQLAKFKIDGSGQKHSYVMISLKVCSSKLALRTSDKTIGRIYLGPCFYYDDGSLTPWGKVVLRKENFAGSFQMYL